MAKGIASANSQINDRSSTPLKSKTKNPLFNKASILLAVQPKPGADVT